jgi:uncharacterized protein (TIGR03437 family)
MKTSATYTRLIFGLVFGLWLLGLTALLFPYNSPVRGQGEKIQLAGQNFSDTRSVVLTGAQEAQAGSSYSPAQAITELAVDDGMFEAAVGLSGGGTVTGVNRLTPNSYPSTLTGVLIFFQSQQGLPPASPITILVGTNPSGGANINNVVFTQISAAVETAGSFYLYAVTPVTINSGDFVVGFRATHAAGQLPLAIDRSQPMNRRSYVSTSGTTFTLLDDAIPSLAGNFLIRARVQGQPPGCPSVSNINPPGGVVGSQVTITGTNFNGVTSVRFAGGVAAQFTINSNTQITVTVPQGATTGPITISKPNCPDVQTAPFAVNTGPPGELVVDDGTFETTQGLSNGGTSHRVNRLTPSGYPATLNAVSIFWHNNSRLNVGDQVTIAFGPNLSGGTGINGLQLQTVAGTVQALGQFNIYNVPALTINSGDFVVGYIITHATGVFPFAVDTTPPSQRRSYRSTNGGATYQIIDDIGTAGNYGIRARLQTQMQNCPTVSGINPTNGGAGSQVIITGSNFTGISAVRFANNVSANFTVNSDTQITATVPAGAVTGPITISKQNCPDATTAIFTVPGGCTYSINPTSQSFSSSGGSGSVAVNTQAGCAWTAVSNASFITITSGSSGNGSGTVNYSVAANTGATRTGTMTIAGQTFTVTQSGGSCTYSITPTSKSFTVEGGSDSVMVNTQAGCAWTATSDASWITITAGNSGNGSGTVSYSVSSNVGGASRSGAMTIAGRTFTVSQSGCTYALSASNQVFSLNGGAGSVNVTAASGCMWTAMSNAPWITINSGASGDGAGTVNYSVEANTGLARLGTMTIAGRTFTVAQGSDQPTPYRGLWQGTTDQNLPLRFIVDNNDIVVNVEADVRITYTIPPFSQATCTYRLRGEAPAIINNGQFEVVLASTDFSLGFQVGAQPRVRATFSSASASSGQITSSTVGLIICGTNLTFGSLSVGQKTWNAQKQMQPIGALASVSAASFLGAELAPESIVAGFGQNLSTTTQVATGLPLPTELAGTTVKVLDSAGIVRLAGALNVASVERPAGLFFVAPTQVNYQMPPGTAAGQATVTITSGSGAVSTGTVNIASVAPGLFSANASGQGAAAAVVFRRRADGSESFEPVARFDQAQGRFVTVPIDLGPETDQVFLILYGVGFRFRSSLSAATVAIGGVNSEVLFAGDAPGFVGLDQANVRLSRSLIGRGEVDVVLTVDSKAANTVRIAFR